MDFPITTDDCKPWAIAIAEHFRGPGVTIKPDANKWDDQPLRPTLLVEKKGLTKHIEVKTTLVYDTTRRSFAHWMSARRVYGEFYLGIPKDTIIHAGTLSDMRRDGVGLLVVDSDGRVDVEIAPRNHALIVTPDPTLRFGRLKHEVEGSVTKYNGIDRKDGFRDMCEIAERETEKLIVKASKKGYINLSEAIVRGKDWDSQINTLASVNVCGAGKNPIFDNALKNDMLSFKGARNLFDHPVRGRRAEIERLKQGSERMMQGPRLIAKLVSLQRKIQ